MKTLKQRTLFYYLCNQNYSTLQLIKKNILKKSLLFICLLGFLFMGCENELAETADAGGFSVSEAKNFYYKNTQSIYNDIGKTIDWESGVFHEFKDKKILEYFLYEKSIKVIVPVTNKTLKSEVNEILGSVFAKVVFIKTKDKIVMRELYYVPELNYLQKKNYEISETYFGEKNGDFSGLIFTENTNDEIILISKVKNAKIISSSFPSKGKLYEKHKLIIVYNRGGDGGIDGGTIEQVVISGNSSNNNSPYDWTGFNPYVEVPYVSPFDNPYASCEGPNCDGNGNGNNNGENNNNNTTSTDPPCQKAQDLMQSTTFKNNMHILDTLRGADREYGYSYSTTGLFTTLSQNPNNTDHSVIIPDDESIIGIMHSHTEHYNENGDLKTAQIFSPDDIVGFLNILSYNNVPGKSVSNVYMSVTTTVGTYVLSYTGMATSTTNFNPTNFTNSNAVTVDYIDYYDKYKAEEGFLRFFRDKVGLNNVNLTLIKRDGTIEKKSLNQNGSVIENNPC